MVLKLDMCTYEDEKEMNISPVVQLSPNGEYLNEFESIADAMDYLGVENNHDSGNICTVCMGKLKWHLTPDGCTKRII